MRLIIRPIAYGTLASLALLVIYFSLLTVLSGWSFTLSQFSDFWYFIVALAVGFGVQVGLYFHLRGLIKGMHGGAGVVGVTGATSTAAMVSCCSHYLANVLPIIGATGLVVFASKYQVEFFWVGILLNLAGILYIWSRVKKVKQYEAI